ncbi:MAG: CHRD domain-containing protein [Acetobacteraceae bacterium]|nr:CHRD domain-containing protein [Acetobacteraceae bacterium]
MRRYNVAAIAVATVIGLTANHAFGQQFISRLTGFDEIGSIPTPYTGAILSNGKAIARLTLDPNAGTIAYTLTYSNVGTTQPSTGTVTQAHIHLGKNHSSGGILVFFCSNLDNKPAGTQACPANSGTVSGTWTAADVQAIPGENVAAGDFDALTDALFSNTAYANIHTTAFPAGEIRGQVYPVGRQRESDY